MAGPEPREQSRDRPCYCSPRPRWLWPASPSSSSWAGDRPPGRAGPRSALIERWRQPLQLRPEARYLFLSEDGEPLTKDGLDSAWRRLIKAAMRDGVITDEQRFSLHDLKRKGGTATAGNVADKQTALGVSPAMMKVYYLSVPLVKPSEY